jgi:hypothetical protein
MYSLRFNLQSRCFRARVDSDIFLVLICGTRAQNLSAPFRYSLYIGRFSRSEYVKKDFTGIGWKDVEWIQVVQSKFHWRSLVNTDLPDSVRDWNLINHRDTCWFLKDVATQSCS